MDDLPLLHRWLNTEHVAQWYRGRDHYPMYNHVVAKYTPRITGETPTDPYLILYRDMPIGYIQTYRIADHPDYASAVRVGEGAAGVDIAIGEADYVHRGLGAHIIRRFLKEIVFGKGDATSCILGPDPANAVAIRAYEKAGLRHLKTVHIPGGDPPEEYIMRIAREDVIDISDDSPRRP